MRLFENGVSDAFNGSQHLMIPKPHHFDAIFFKIFCPDFVFPAHLVFAVLTAI